MPHRKELNLKRRVSKFNTFVTRNKTALKHVALAIALTVGNKAKAHRTFKPIWFFPDTQGHLKKPKKFKF